MQSDCLLMEKDEHSASQLPLSLEYPCAIGDFLLCCFHTTTS